jgi:hypothetical protein
MRINKKIREAVGIPNKVEMLVQSVSEVSKYELLTTNQYLQQMELVLAIFEDISQEMQVQPPI